MFYATELRFLQETLKKGHIQSLLLDKDTIPDHRLDLGLRQQLGLESDYARFIREHLSAVQPCTVYKLTDSFLCNYLYLRLPAEQPTHLMIGPYLEEELTRKQLLEQAERIGIPPQRLRQLETYYTGLPVLQGDHTVFSMLTVFFETIWGSNSYTMVDINRDIRDTFALPIKVQPENALQNMQIMEARYASENELISAVSQGLTHKAELMFSGFPQRAIEERLTDRVRNLKNYGIIMNTLLRKAAESGGVHPVYLDQTSNDFAQRIEQAPSVTALRELMTTMARSYSLLVKRHSMKNYSPPVQRTITCIDTDLAGDLSLRTLAAMQSINPSYLSALFRRETGQTLTEHVNKKRIRLASQLLTTTRLQIQTVAQHCGIPDVNYFSKLFKKHTGKTPREYRLTAPLTEQ